MEPTFRNLDIDLLRTLITIADTGSFSGAATRLGRTQSAVSLQVKRLEEAVGDALLLRSHGRVSGPTAEGSLLIDYGRRILRLNDEAYSCFARPELSGRLRVGLPEEVMEVAFSKVQADFSAACPRVELSVRCDLSVRLVELVEMGELDLALARRLSTGGEAEIPRGWRVIRREPLVCHWRRQHSHRLEPTAGRHFSRRLRAANSCPGRVSNGAHTLAPGFCRQQLLGAPSCGSFGHRRYTAAQERVVAWHGRGKRLASRVAGRRDDDRLCTGRGALGRTTVRANYRKTAVATRLKEGLSWPRGAFERTHRRAHGPVY